MKLGLSASIALCALCMLNACGGGSSGAKPGSGGSESDVATHFALTAPAAASVNTFFILTIEALDSSNSTVGDYSGTVHFTSTDPNADLPGDLTLTNGTATLSVSLTSLGSQTITATDTVKAGIIGSSMSIGVAVSSDPRGFQPTGDMGTPRVSQTATLLANGKVLVTGGYNRLEVLATAELFDPATGTFTPTGSMTTVRFFHTATLLANGKVLVAGGSDDNNSVDSGGLATAELYDPATGTFTATGKMSEPRSEHTATLLANGKVLVAGGADDNVAELFDPTTGTFTPTQGKLITGGRWGCTATLLSDGTVLIAGGRDNENVYDAYSDNDAELFNPATGNFTSIGPMTESRYDHTATLLKNGEVLVTGGFNANPVGSAELFDPAKGSFSATGSMGTPRAQHTAALLYDGTVLVAGGFSFTAPGGSFSNAELFDPATNMFTPSGPMGVPRFLHTSTRLQSGLVLVTGGESNFTPPGVFANSANLYK